jgi:hypothetical protein
MPPDKPFPFAGTVLFGIVGDSPGANLQFGLVCARHNRHMCPLLSACQGFCRMAEKKKASTRKPATKFSVLGVRLEPGVRAALDKCAADDERPISVMAHKIIADYLREKDYLK